MDKYGKILVAEDDADINHLICEILRKENYQAVSSFSGTEAALRLSLERFDLLILDLMLPGMDGESLLGKIREEEKKELPVLILSAKSALENKVSLLMQGADDYMTKPFEPQELAARVYACLRRAGKAPLPQPSRPCLSFRKLSLFPESRKAEVSGDELMLTPHEYEILYLLLQSPDKVFSRETLYEQVWKGGYYGEDNTVNVHVSNLRKKIAAVDPDAEYIKTIWGIGFKLA
ncbi:MAG: response regulator transcription factor [Lachnospiraceae bacterium]|nr:response regulator transcription factor [Lachnospiraceae bacterium]